MRGALSRRRLQQGLKKHEFGEKQPANHFASWFSIIYIRILESWNIEYVILAPPFLPELPASLDLASPVYGFSSSRANLPRPSGLPPSSLTPPHATTPFPNHINTHTTSPPLLRVLNRGIHSTSTVMHLSRSRGGWGVGDSVGHGGCGRRGQRGGGSWGGPSTPADAWGLGGGTCSGHTAR